MLKTLCKTCNMYTKCNYCITYGRKIGQEFNANANKIFCKTCKLYELCMFCDKFGKKQGQIYYKHYLDHINDSRL